MTLEEAVKILNNVKHNGVSDYEICNLSNFSTDKIVSGGISSYRYTEFEAIAIAEKYLLSR